MEVIEQDPQYKDPFEPSAVKHRLGELRRRIKRIDLRAMVIEHPFPAIGIGFAAGALVGLLRPIPQRGRLSSALVALTTGLAFRAIRDTAITQLGLYAKELLANKNPNPDAAAARPF